MIEVFPERTDRRYDETRSVCLIYPSLRIGRGFSRSFGIQYLGTRHWVFAGSSADSW
jgi:hypothetical protein